MTDPARLPSRQDGSPWQEEADDLAAVLAAFVYAEGCEGKARACVEGGRCRWCIARDAYAGYMHRRSHVAA